MNDAVELSLRLALADAATRRDWPAFRAARLALADRLEELEWLPESAMTRAEWSWLRTTSSVKYAGVPVIEYWDVPGRGWYERLHGTAKRHPLNKSVQTPGKIFGAHNARPVLHFAAGELKLVGVKQAADRSELLEFTRVAGRGEAGQHRKDRCQVAGGFAALFHSED